MRLIRMECKTCVGAYFVYSCGIDCGWPVQILHPTPVILPWTSWEAWFVCNSVEYEHLLNENVTSRKNTKKLYISNKNLLQVSIVRYPSKQDPAQNLYAACMMLHMETHYNEIRMNRKRKFDYLSETYIRKMVLEVGLLVCFLLRRHRWLLHSCMLSEVLVHHSCILRAHFPTLSKFYPTRTC